MLEDETRIEGRVWAGAGLLSTIVALVPNCGGEQRRRRDHLHGRYCEVLRKSKRRDRIADYDALYWCSPEHFRGLADKKPVSGKGQDASGTGSGHGGGRARDRRAGCDDVVKQQYGRPTDISDYHGASAYRAAAAAFVQEDLS